MSDVAPADAVDADGVRRILEERARQLARSSDDDADTETAGLIVLAIGDERYGADMVAVQEIEPLQRLTPLPGTPAHWAGVVNLRGDMYPVLDLRRYLGLSGTVADDPKVALVCDDGLSIGLMVDDVEEVRHVPVGDISPPVAHGGARAEVVRGVTSDMLSVLDLHALVCDQSLVVEDGAD